MNLPAVKTIIKTIVVCNILMAIYYFFYLVKFGYLPAPFIFDKSNTFMDFFNPLYWAFDEGRYTEWGSVYPPLNFFLLRFSKFFFDFHLGDSPDELRENFSNFIYWWTFFYLISTYLMVNMKYWCQQTYQDRLLYFFLIFSYFKAFKKLLLKF